MKTFKTMLKNEMKLSLRDMNMVIFGICIPLVVLILLGVIYGNKPASPSAEYTFLEQSFGALTTIAVCAGGVMGLPLVVSDYRNKKILKRFKVTPVSPGMILAVQVAIYTIYSVASLILLSIVSAVFWGFRMEGSIVAFLGSYLLVMLSIFSIGMMVGGISPNSQTASVIASLLYLPMLIFSGATLPYEVMPEAMQKVVGILPLTQGIKLLKATSLGLPIESAFVPMIVMAVLAVICIGVSLCFFKWE